MEFYLFEIKIVGWVMSRRCRLFTRVCAERIVVLARPDRAKNVVISPSKPKHGSAEVYIDLNPRKIDDPPLFSIKKRCLMQPNKTHIVNPREKSNRT